MEEKQQRQKLRDPLLGHIKDEQQQHGALLNEPKNTVATTSVLSENHGPESGSVPSSSLLSATAYHPTQEEELELTQQQQQRSQNKQESRKQEQQHGIHPMEIALPDDDEQNRTGEEGGHDDRRID